MQSHPRRHEQVELVVGMDDTPLALHTGTGRYHRLSRPAAATLRLLDGVRSTDELAAAYAGTRPDPAAARAEFDAFLAALARAGLLAGTEPVRPARRRSRTMPRFVVTRRLPVLLEPLAARLRGGRRAAVATALLAVAGLAGAALGVAAFVDVDVRQPGLATGGGAAFGIAAVVLLAIVCVHEAMHALVAQVLRVPVRGAGFALLFWALPVAYVDRTDAYRLRGRAGRVVLAVAGPLSDGVAAGVTAMLAWHGPPSVTAVAARLLAFQTFALVLNANPLLPSDLYVAAEAAFGLVDPRGRAFGLIRAALRREPAPAHLATLSRRSKVAHVAYGLACFLYAVVLLAATARWLAAVVRPLW